MVGLVIKMLKIQLNDIRGELFLYVLCANTFVSLCLIYIISSISIDSTNQHQAMSILSYIVGSSLQLFIYNTTNYT